MSRYIIIFFFFLIENFCYSQKQYELGYKEYLYGDLNKALDLFSKSIEDNQEVAKSYMMRGVTKAYLNDFYHAIEDLNESHKIDSSDYYLYYSYGKVYVLSGFYNKGLEYLNRAIFINQNDEYVYDYRAITKIKLDDYEGAIKDENIAITLNPKIDYFYNARGFAKAGLKMYKEAIEDYTKALELIPEDYFMYYYRGLAYKKLNKKDLACNDFKKSAELGYSLASKELTNFCGLSDIKSE